MYCKYPLLSAVLRNKKYWTQIASILHWTRSEIVISGSRVHPIMWQTAMSTHAVIHTRAPFAHLSQLFVQSGGPGLGCRVALRAEHLLVPVDEVAVAQSDHLHTGEQTIQRGI